MSSQLSVLLGQTFSHEPDFVKLVEDDPGGIISCTTHPLKAYISSFPIRLVAAHLEFIWSSKQPQNRRYIFTGPNPAKGRMEGDLRNQFNSKCQETLGHKNTLDNEYNQGPKV